MTVMHSESEEYREKQMVPIHADGVLKPSSSSICYYCPNPCQFHDCAADLYNMNNQNLTIVRSAIHYLRQ